MSLQSKLLVASPVLQDPWFGGKVVFVAKYDPQKGAEGFILNGPIVGKVGFGEIKNADDMPQNNQEVVAAVESGAIESAPLCAGGPCRSPGIFMIHGYEGFLKSSGEPEFELGITLLEESENDNTISPGIYYGTPATMARIVMEGKTSEGKFRFFTGITAWSPGQLEREIEAGAWEVKDSTPDLVFDTSAAEKLVVPKIPEDDDPPPYRIPTPSMN